MTGAAARDDRDFGVGGQLFRGTAVNDLVRFVKSEGRIGYSERVEGRVDEVS